MTDILDILNDESQRLKEGIKMELASRGGVNHGALLVWENGETLFIPMLTDPDSATRAGAVYLEELARQMEADGLILWGEAVWSEPGEDPGDEASVIGMNLYEDSVTHMDPSGGSVYIVTMSKHGAFAIMAPVAGDRIVESQTTSGPVSLMPGMANPFDLEVEEV